MSQFPDALVRRLQARQQVLKVAKPIKRRLFQNLRALKELSFFDLCSFLTKITLNKYKYLKSRVNKLKNYIWVNVFETYVNELFEEHLN